ncbi:MAG: proton-conducting transporter membrane subunit [Clostridia bacterium]
MEMFSFTLDAFRLLQVALTIGIFGFALSLLKGVSKRLIGFMIATFIGTIGVFLSGSLFTLFFFFEIMSMASYGFVIESDDANVKKVSNFYLFVSIIAGMLMLLGMFLLYNELQTLEFSLMHEAAENANMSNLYISGALVLVGFCTKAGVYPLHIWLPDTYTICPSPLTAVFSAILSKTGVFGAVILSVNIFYYDASFGQVLMVFAFITMLWGGICAICQNDMKKTVAYSSMSQIGFIFVGIAMLAIMGEHNTIAAMGIVLHMLNHSLFKVILFGICAILVYNVGSTKFDDIKGIARKNPFIGTVFVIAAAGLAGVPFISSGYISKTLLHESIVEQNLLHSAFYLGVCDVLFLVAGGLTAAYMLKIGMVLFAKNDKAVKVKVPVITSAFFAVIAVMAVAMGLFPAQTAQALAASAIEVLHVHTTELEMHYFNFTNLKGAVISLTIGALIYFFIIKKFLITKDEKYIDINNTKFSLENTVYRPVVQEIIPRFLTGLSTLFGEKIFDVFGLVKNLYKVPEFFDYKAIDIVFKLVFTIVVSISHLLSSVTWWFIELLIAIGFKPRITQDQLISHNFSYAFGKKLDYLATKINRNVKHDYAKTLEIYQENSALRRRMISASLSYGLLFAGIGLVIVLFYLLLV